MSLSLNPEVRPAKPSHGVSAPLSHTHNIQRAVPARRPGPVLAPPVARSRLVNPSPESNGCSSPWGKRVHVVDLGQGARGLWHRGSLLN
jgi:hypothetical protein